MLGIARGGCLSLLFFLLAPSAALAAVEPEDFLICRNQKTVRTVRVVKKDGECVTIYTKGGVDKDVGGGKHYQSCTRIMNNIRGNLENAGWKCREVNDAAVTHSTALSQ